MWDFLVTDGLRMSHLRKAPQVGLSEVGLPEGNRALWGRRSGAGNIPQGVVEGQR